MTLLSLSNVDISFGATELLKDVTFTVADGERWGIVGRNGAGKTSIFKVITGDLQPTTGSVARKPGLRHALLDQHRAFEGATTVWQAGAAAWREVMALALMTLARANLLVLDEPTNHLDVENIEVLEDALDEYDGTVLLVSHDRAFLREVATREWSSGYSARNASIGSTLSARRVGTTHANRHTPKMTHP